MYFSHGKPSYIFVDTSVPRTQVLIAYELWFQFTRGWIEVVSNNPAFHKRKQEELILVGL